MDIPQDHSAQTEQYATGGVINTEAELGAALASSNTVSLNDDITLTQDLTVPAGTVLVLFSDCTLTVSAGVTLTLDGSISLIQGNLSFAAGSFFVNNGELSFSDADVDFNGSYSGSGSINISSALPRRLSITGSKRDEFLTDYLSCSEQKDLFADVTLTRDLSTENGAIRIINGAKLTVPSGRTLTASSYSVTVNSGSLEVQPGGRLVNNSSIELGSYSDTSKSGALVMNGSCEGTGWTYVYSDGSSCTGMEQSHVRRVYNIYSPEDIPDSIDQSYSSASVNVYCELTVSEPLLLPNNTTLHILQPVTVADGGSITASGSCLISDNVTVQSGGRLTINGGGNLAGIRSYGDDGEWVYPPAVLTIDFGAVLELNSYYQLGSTSTGPDGEHETDGKLVVNGVVTGSGFVSLNSDGSSVTGSGTLPSRITCSREVFTVERLVSVIASAAANPDTSYSIYVYAPMSLTQSITFPRNAQVTVSGGDMTVSSGAVLTVNSSLQLTSNRTLTIDSGSVVLQTDDSTVSGNVPASAAQYRASAGDEAQLRSAISSSAASTKTWVISLYGPITLTQSLTIPRNALINCYNDLTVSAGTLTVNGDIEVDGGATLTVNAGASMVNNAEIRLGYVSDSGSSDGTLVINGSYSGTGCARINTSGSSVTGANASKVRMVSGSAPSTGTVTLSAPASTLEVGKTLQITATLSGYTGAKPGLTWSSSDTSIATVSSTGLVKAIAPGSVTITATAADGSNKSAAVKLVLVKLMESVNIPGEASLAGGKRLTLKPNIDKTVTNNKLIWTLSGDTAFATLSTNGVLTAKPVTGVKQVFATATAADGSASETCAVTIYPATLRVTITLNGAPVPTRPIPTLAQGATATLSATSYPLSALQEWTWRSSNPSLATVDQHGNVQANTAHKSGTVTITATSTDGSAKSASVKLSVTK